MSSTDYLTEDSLLPKDQNFVCISFLSDPENKLTLTGVKVRGVFRDVESASAHAKKLQSVDPAHNIFVGSMGKWLAYDPDTTTEAAGNPEYANEQLNNIMKGYLDNQEKSKLFHEERKLKNIREGIESAIETSTSKVKDIQQEILESKDDANIQSLKDKLESINKQIKELTEKKDDINKQEKSVSKKLEGKKSEVQVSV